MLSRTLLVLGLCTALAACDSNLSDGDPTIEKPADNSGPTVAPDDLLPSGANGVATNDSLTLKVGNGTIQLEEGANAINVPVSITRHAGSLGNIELSAAGQTVADTTHLSWTFVDSDLSNSETTTELEMHLDIATRPIQPQTRTLVVTASSAGSALLSTAIDIAIQPTSLPDVYLIVGQSNAMGFSEDDSKQAGPGGPDAPNDRIKQLNVTGNDGENFVVASDFTSADNLYNAGMPLTPAVDPLHDGYDSNLEGKAAQRIGFALSFAKAALADTTADIYLVPAAWSDTGFCKRTTNRLPGIGWNATATNNDALSGSLLYDRAIMRTDIALELTGGVLRGILWHQGEADSDDIACAETYAANLTKLVAALRTHIDQDPRGASARGADADVPFIVGTMSMGSDAQSNQTPFSDTKQIVDNAHRNIGSLVHMADYVNNDDLVPPAYPCGEGSCVHFGAAAYREMGSRYYERLISLVP